MTLVANGQTLQAGAALKGPKGITDFLAGFFGKVSAEDDQAARLCLWYRKVAAKAKMKPLRAGAGRDAFGYGAVRQVGALQIGYELRPEGAVISLLFPEETLSQGSALRRRTEAAFERLADRIEGGLEGRVERICRTPFFAYAYLRGGAGLHPSLWATAQGEHLAVIGAFLKAAESSCLGAKPSRLA